SLRRSVGVPERADSLRGLAVQELGVPVVVADHGCDVLAGFLVRNRLDEFQKPTLSFAFAHPASYRVRAGVVARKSQRDVAIKAIEDSLEVLAPQLYVGFGDEQL